MTQLKRTRIIGVTQHAEGYVEALITDSHGGEDAVFHWVDVERKKHQRAVFYSKAGCDSAWKNLDAVNFTDTNTVAGLPINEAELFMLRRKFLSENRMLVAGMARKIIEVMYPNLGDLIIKCLKPAPVPGAADDRPTLGIKLNFPLLSGEVHRGYFIRAVAAGPVVEQGELAVRTMIANRIKETLLEGLTQGMISVKSMGRSKDSPESPSVVVGEHRLFIGDGFLAYRPEVHVNSGTLDLCDKSICFEICNRAPTKAMDMDEYTAHTLLTRITL